MVILGVLGLYAVINNFTTRYALRLFCILYSLLMFNAVSAVSFNATLIFQLVFGIRFVENVAVWVILWFFTDTVVNRIDSNVTSIHYSSSKNKSQQLSNKNLKISANIAVENTIK